MAKRTSVYLLVVAGLALTAGRGWAQEATGAQPATPAAPAEGTVELPKMTVETTTAKKVAKKPAPKKQAQSASTATPTPQLQTQPSGASRAETATGPVSGYNATRSATGMKTDTPLKETPQSITVVGAEQIRDMGAQSVQDALRYVPGVVADAYGLDSRSDGSFIRGTDPGEFLDGLRRTSNYYSYNYRIDPYFMERVEVLRGPASVLYGQAPVGGIINSVSKRPQDVQSGEISVEYGTFDFKQVKFDTTGLVTSDGKWSYRLTGLARDSETQVDYVDDDRYAIQPAISFRPDSNTSITLLGHFQKDQTGSSSQFYPIVGTLFPNVNGRTIPRDRFVGEPTDHYDTDVASGTLIAEHRFNSVFKLSHVSRYADIHNDYDSTYAVFWGGYTDPGVEETVNRTRWRAITDTQIFNQDTNLEAKFSTGILSHKVLGGVDHMNFRASQGTASAYDLSGFNVYNPVYGQGMWAGKDCSGNTYDGISTSLPSLEICSFADQKVTQTGLYIQDQIRLGNWIAVLGARKDWIENEADGTATQKDDAVSYRAGLMYEFASGFTPYASYGESFVPVVAAGGPFDPQKGRMYELGFKYQPVGANFAINSAIYDIAESNRLEYFPGYAVQTGAVAIRGFEIELTGKITQNLKVVGGYSYTDAQYDGEENKGNQLESVPKHLASMWGVWEFDQPYLKGWSVGAGVRYVGESWDSSNKIEVPDVTLFDAMIAYEEDDWRWSINAKNLEDKEYISTCLNRGDCWYGNARTITTGLTYKF
ncbi:TonB-dependent siderophore receptor [Hyphomicrobium sp. LHD-15]|uniref:TonB-dependent siderophore receptor n=1 Tax=Hyphomicrobium sp. LHD-15 TaxID=3072142 RepID=UPI00280D64C0|nr:TonB-dependent siderophore receptor [Hyphomicrobium sp. LHD-15]MDQ8700722.1 TonB-dependent siderophore receptor [Hyphomicrobium sp. LHD-15]